LKFKNILKNEIVVELVVMFGENFVPRKKINKIKQLKNNAKQNAYIELTLLIGFDQLTRFQ
jgi:hypothetical protein